MSVKIPESPPEFRSLLSGIAPERLGSIIAAGGSTRGKYRHWSELRHLDPPGDLSLEDWWLGIKLARMADSDPLPLRDKEGKPFTYSMPDEAQRAVHLVDQGAAGRISISESVVGTGNRDRYVLSSLIEEAITSSQLEGASTSRRVAKEMLHSGREPRNRSERMIVNNYRAMEYVRRRRNDPLDPEFVFELHDIVTRGTLDNEDEAGRLQKPDEDRVAVYSPEDEIIHIPPPAEELPARLEAMCEFANSSDETEDGGSSGTFLHPVVRAVLLHFWVGYDHPFADGNGRTARALFYWSMLRQGYWLAESLTISSILKNAPSKYATSYLFTETDDGDTTYFVLYQLGVILRAMDELEGYLRRKMEETRRTEALIKTDADFNHRQTALLAHALRNPDATYTVKVHGSFHNVVTNTSRTDLDGLAERGLLVKNKAGRAFRYFPVPDLSEKLEA